MMGKLLRKTGFGIGFGAALMVSSASFAAHTHHLAVFGGATVASGNSAITLGADYEYNLMPTLGLLALVDHARFAVPTTVIGLGLDFHPGMGMKVFGAPIVELGGGTTHVGGRAGAGYDFELAHFVTFGPQASVDFINGHVAGVFGVTVGIGF